MTIAPSELLATAVLLAPVLLIVAALLGWQPLRRHHDDAERR